MTVTASAQSFYRVEICKHLAFEADHKANMNYSEDRPIPEVNQSMAGMEKLFAEGFQWFVDCYGAVDWAFDWSGMRSPAGEPWSLGDSLLCWQRLPHFTDPGGTGHGTLGVYGLEGDAHIVVVTTPGNTREETLVFSHGSEHECYYDIPLAEEDTAHQGEPFVFLSIVPLFPQHNKEEA